MKLRSDQASRPGESDLAGRMPIDWLDAPYIELDFRSTYLDLPLHALFLSETGKHC